MSKLVSTGTQLRCSYGTMPSYFIAPPTNRVTASNNPAATIMDHIPMINVAPFSLCTSLLNPAVSFAGCPQPCVPVISTPWSLGSKRVMISKKPALNSNSQCMCSWSGIIKITQPGQSRVNVK